MLIRTTLGVAMAAVTIAAAAPSFAQTVPADTNKTLWCASAFTLVEPQARKAGQAEAADHFKAYAATLEGQSHDALIKAGFTEDQVKTQSATYLDKVNKQLGGTGGAPEFSVLDCTKLVDPAAAAAIQAGTAPTPAPAPATQAPAAKPAGK